MPVIAGVLLAAGGARRFGGPKLHAPLADGTPMALASARALGAALPYSFAVVPPEDPTLAVLVSGAGLRVLVAPADYPGIGVSLACAARAAGGADGIVVALADMPFIQIDTVAAVAKALAAGAALAAPAYRGRRGHPVGFSAAFLPVLACLSGDHGAADLLASNPQALTLLPTDDAAVLIDLDTPDAVAMACSRNVSRCATAKWREHT